MMSSETERNGAESEKNGAESEDEGEIYETAKREGKVVVRTNRRTLIPEKPNVSLNLWNLVKNSIGEITTIQILFPPPTTSS